MVTIPIERCEYPLKLFRGNSFIHVPCGHCSACRHSKQSSWRSRLVHHIISSPSTLFLTLTYSNEHLPLVEYDPETLKILSVTHTTFTRSGETKRVDITDCFEKDFPNFQNIFCNDPQYFDPVFGTSPTDPTESSTEVLYYESNDIKPIKFPHYVASRDSHGVTFDTSNTFAFCLRKDYQDFFRRLRTLLSRNPDLVGEDLTISYFICSEYGPKTYRPHFHACVFFNSERVARYCHAYGIHRAWRKSSDSPDVLEKESQWVTTADGAASYISKYVTLGSDLPPALSCKPFKCFHQCSKLTPIGSTCIPFSDISYKVLQTDLLYHYSYIDKHTSERINVSVPYPSQLWSTYFPKFLFHGCVSSSLLSRLFERIFTLDPSEECPNLIEQFNSRYQIGTLQHSTGITTRYKDRRLNRLWSSLGAVRPFDFLHFGRDCDFVHSTTYSMIWSEFSACLESSVYSKDLTYIDLFLFGIPQNRAVVNKILRLRRSSVSLADNWLHSYQSYLYIYNRFYSKSFANSLRKFYETAAQAPDQNSPAFVQEYYPTFWINLPKYLGSLRPETYETLSDILNYRFNLSLEDFYDSDFNLIDFNPYHSHIYNYYHYYLRSLEIEFCTKRKYYHDKYLSG